MSLPVSDLSTQEKLAAIKESRVYFKLRYFKKQNSFVPGETVLVGSEYDNRSLKLGVIVKEDGRRVVHVKTEDGIIRFSARYEYLSTQKVHNAYWEIFDFEETYQGFLEWQKSDRVSKLCRRRRELVEYIDQLDFRNENDVELMEKLIQIVEKEEGDRVYIDLKKGELLGAQENRQ